MSKLKCLNKMLKSVTEDSGMDGQQLDLIQFNALKSAKAGKNLLITGPAGSGKSFLIERIVTELKRIGKEPVVTSTTGSSSQLIGGRTVHSYLAIGIGTKPLEEIIKMIRIRKMKPRYTDIDCLIIDEISMMSGELLNKIEIICRTIRRNNEPFGGLQIILVGDFYQLPFIESDIDKSFCFEHKEFNKWFGKPFKLERIFRLSSKTAHKDDQESHRIELRNKMWLNILKESRLGSVSKKTMLCLGTRKIANCPTEYNELIANGFEPTRIYPRKIQVASINKRELDKLPDVKYTFAPELKIDREAGCELTPSKIKLKLKGELDKLVAVELCVGAQVMVTKNSKDGILVNGSRGIVVAVYGTNQVEIKTKDGTNHVIERTIESVPHPDNGSTWEATVSILPLQLAWAVTIHKSQGMTLDLVECDLGNNIFEYGQAYVALSRVRNLDSLFIRELAVDVFKVSPKVCDFYKSLQE